MSLHLVGETVGKSRSHAQAQAGRFVQLMRGIYVDAEDDADALVLRHAVRIAKYLYPNAYLSGASASLLAPTRDGRLFISGRRVQRTRIRGLEIIQNKAPRRPSVGDAVIDDGMGEFRTGASSMRQRFLEAFRLRSEHAASIGEAMREAIAARLVAEYRSPKGAADALWVLARENEWHREAELAERFLMRGPSTITVRNEAALDLIVAWHGTPIGHLSHDGYEWRWTPEAAARPPVVRATAPGKLPAFIASLLPEGWLERALKSPDERMLLRSGKRYVSNIAIVRSVEDLIALPQDVLRTRLEQHAAGGLFTGTYAGPRRDAIEKDFEASLAKLYERADTPRLSGVQIKAPMFLDADGTLAPSIERPFTHILKPAGGSGFEWLPVVEWIALALGRAAGFIVPDSALVEMPDGMPPALLVERFDIRAGDDDRRLIALEDFASVLDLPAQAKYSGTIERVARAARSLSTAPDDDVVTVVGRALFAWLIGDGDMHLKNLALLKVAEPGDAQFRSVRLAPLYDAVTTRVFPRLEHDRMALKVNGKDTRLRPADFRAAASTAGVRVGDIDATIDGVLARVREALGRVALPELRRYRAEAAGVMEKVAAVVRGQLDGFA